MTADIDQLIRIKASVDISRNILPSSPKYSQQFSQIYFCRINQLKRALRERAENTFPGCYILEKTLDLPANSGTTDHVLIGCLYCELPSKPDVLKDLDAEHLNIATASHVHTYVGSSAASKYYLEDEYGRVELLNTECIPFPLITGVTTAVRGTSTSGKLLCNAACVAGKPPKPEINDAPASENLILFVSGIEYGGSPEADSAFNRLIDALAGVDTCSDDGSGGIFKKVDAVVLVGNVLSPPIRLEDSQKRKYGHENISYDLSGVQALDERLAILAQTLKVVIIPGIKDPTNETLPQAPLSPIFFPRSLNVGSITFLENPCQFAIHSVNILASGGQNVADMARYCDPNVKELELARFNIDSRHVAPTAPDTLPCYPYEDLDPFVLSVSPDVYIVGAGNEFAADYGSNNEDPVTLLIPSFAKTKQVVLFSNKDRRAQVVEMD